MPNLAGKPKLESEEITDFFHEIEVLTSLATYILMDALVMSSKRLKVGRENSVGVIGYKICVAITKVMKPNMFVESKLLNTIVVIFLQFDHLLKNEQHPFKSAAQNSHISGCVHLEILEGAESSTKK
ncbi:hypothetical protein TSUD_316100 [Trifolium subterraneum]|uniref:Uncharacterized protein n=1 Tax=Trifolium subterraneum TaxID=3900 RepID=A0A2Z6MV10_TRISU|nr:hypothetical protein TSUD_316100 [Trifolium subterraneum]